MILIHQVPFASEDKGMFDNEQYFDADDLPPEFDSDDDPEPGVPIDNHLFVLTVIIIGLVYRKKRVVTKKF